MSVELLEDSIIRVDEWRDDTWFCKHCGESIECVYVQDGYDSGYENHCNCTTFNKVSELKDEKISLELRIREIDNELRKCENVTSEKAKMYFWNKTKSEFESKFGSVEDLE